MRTEIVRAGANTMNLLTVIHPELILIGGAPFIVACFIAPEYERRPSSHWRLWDSCSARQVRLI
jgi:hypothetical protein